MNFKQIISFVALLTYVQNCDSDQYYKFFTGCIQCITVKSNCIQCYDFFGVKCTKCQDGWYANNGQCSTCPYPCLTCNSATDCLSCDNNYYLLLSGSGYICEPCSPLCSCSNSQCTGCLLSVLPQYYYTTDVNGVNYCQSCLTGCISCTSATDCDDCQPAGYYLDGGICTVCPSNCDCQNNSLCVRCHTDNWKNASSGFCQSCPQYCVCDNQVMCSSCQATYWKNLTSGYCQTCPNLCNCDNSIFCSSCHNDTYRNTSTGYCQECPALCYCESQAYCSSCYSNTYRNASTGLCDECPEHCYCANQTMCSSCQATYWKNDTSGYCEACPPLCVCDNSQYCSSCISTAYKNDTECVQCPLYCNCQNSTFCSSCVDNAWRTDDGNCSECPYYCLCENQIYCSSCIGKTQYDENKTCIDICGDTHIVSSPCDLQLGNDLDGCTDDCQIQDDFECKVESERSICSYVGNIQISLQTITKEMFQNKLTVEFKVQPQLHLFNTINPGLFLSFRQDSFQNISWTYDSGNGIFQAIFNYNQDIQDITFRLNFNGSESDERFYLTSEFGFQYVLNSEKYSPAVFYTSEEYQFSQAVFIIATILSSLSLLICLIGAFGFRKLAGLQITFVLQYAFVSLIWYNVFIYLPVYCLQNLKYSTGYNHPFYELNESTDPPKAQVYQINTLYLISNFNLMAVLYLIPIIAFIVCKIIHYKTKQPEKKYKYSEKIQFCVELFMYATMFNLTYLITSAIIYFSHGNLTDVGSQVLFSCCLLFTFFSFLGYFLFPAYYLRFRFYFRDDEIGLHHYIFHIICILGTILMIALIPDHSWCPFLLQVPMIIYTFVSQPYKDKNQNYRSIFYYIIMCSITSMRVYFQYSNPEEHRTWSSFVYPLIIEFLIFIGLLWAYIVVLYEIIDQCYFRQKRERNLAYELFQEQETIKRLQNNILHSDLFKAKNILESFAYNSTHSRTSQKERKFYKVITEGVRQKLEEEKKKKNCDENLKIKSEQEMKAWLKKNDLPHNEQAIELIMKEAQFLRYHELVWLKRDDFKKQLDQKAKSIYDAI